MDRDGRRLGLVSVAACWGVCRGRAVEIGRAMEVDAADLNECHRRGFATGESDEQHCGAESWGSQS